MSYNSLEFNKEKFKTVLHYIIDEINVSRGVIFKLLYFADFNFYELYEKPLTNEIYKKYPQGPVPSHFNNIKRELEKEKLITENLNSLKRPNIDVLSTEELNVINGVIAKLSKMNASQISEYCYGDMPWRATKDYEDINYEFVFYRDPKYCVRKYDF